MAQYLIRRLLIAAPVLWGISVLVYGLITLAPGDPVSAMIDPQSGAGMTSQQIETLKRSYGLDRPVYIRYAKWLREAVKGNLGYSYYTNRPVTERIQQRLGTTLQLVTASLLLTVVVGISLGMLSALKRYSVLDHLLTTAAFGSMSIPEFFLALCGIYLFSLQLNLLPSSGVGDVSGDWSLGSYLKHLAMPATILALRPTAILMRYARSSFLEVMRQDYMTVASAKGLGRGAVVLRHGLKNALIPLITVIGLQLPLLVSGAFIIETIFAWPGMGTLLFNAIFQRDYPVIMGVTLVVGIAIVFCNLAADIAYSYADPRIKYE